MFQRKQPQLTREQVLSAVPLRNPKVEVETSEAGHRILIVPLREDWVGRALSAYHKFVFLGRKQEPHRIELDAVGSQVFDLIGNQRTVEELVKELVRVHKLARREVEVSLTEYLKTLGRRGIIAFAVPQEQSEQDPESQNTQAGA